MKPISIALRLWFGTIMIIAGVTGVFALFSLDVFGIFAAIIVLVVGMFFTWPLLITAACLVRISGQIPYGASARTCWLGFLLLLQNFVFLHILGRIELLLFNVPMALAVFFISGFALIIMLFATRTILRNYYSQQTTSNQEL